MDKKIKIFTGYNSTSSGLESVIEDWIKKESPEILGLTMTGESKLTVAIIYKL